MALSNNWFSSPAFQVGNSGSSPDGATKSEIDTASLIPSAHFAVRGARPLYLVSFMLDGGSPPEFRQYLINCQWIFPGIAQSGRAAES